MALASELEASLREFGVSAAIEIRESGRVARLSRLSYEVRGSREKPPLHLWSEEYNVTRRVLAITVHSEQRLALAVERFGRSKPDLLEFVRVEFGQSEREILRQAFCARLSRLNFSASIRHVGLISIVEVAGRLTSFESGALRNSIAQLLKEGHKQIVLNLSRLDYLDSSGIGVLVYTYMSVIKRGGEMKVVGLTKRVEEILEITQLHQVFQEFQDEQSAVSSLAPSGSKGARILEFPSTKN